MTRRTWQTAAALAGLSMSIQLGAPVRAQPGAPASGASAVVEPARLPAFASAVLRVRVRPRRALPAGAVVTTQLPSAMLASTLSYSLTKTLSVRDPQIIMPAAMPTTAQAAAALAAQGNFAQFTRWDTVTVDVQGRDDAAFDVKIEKREFELGTGATSRHGQAVTLSKAGRAGRRRRSSSPTARPLHGWRPRRTGLRGDRRRAALARSDLHDPRRARRHAPRHRPLVCASRRSVPGAARVARPVRQPRDEHAERRIVHHRHARAEGRDHLHGPLPDDRDADRTGASTASR